MLFKKKKLKKSIASKRPRGSSSFNYDCTRFVSTNTEGQFYTLVTWRSGIKKRGFDINVENSRVEDFQRVIHSRGWQLFCKHPKAAAMTVVREFFMNTPEGNLGYMVFVRGK